MSPLMYGVSASPICAIFLRKEKGCFTGSQLTVDRWKIELTLESVGLAADGSEDRTYGC